MPGPFDVPDPIPGVWDVAAVIAWLRSIGVTDVPLVPGAIEASLPDSLDRVGIVTALGSGPRGMEGMETTPRFRLRFRGSQTLPLDAERLSWAADARIERAPLPATVNGVRLLAVQWAGGGPSALPASSGRRAEHDCTYICRIVRRLN